MRSENNIVQQKQVGGDGDPPFFGTGQRTSGRDDAQAFSSAGGNAADGGGSRKNDRKDNDPYNLQHGERYDLFEYASTMLDFVGRDNNNGLVFPLGQAGGAFGRTGCSK